MAARSLNTSTHSNSPINQPGPEIFVISPSNHVSVQDILFGVLTVILAIASVILAYLQLVHMRKQTGSSKLDVEMFVVRKHTFITSYIFLIDDSALGEPLRQNSEQSTISNLSDDTFVEASQEGHRPVLCSVGKVE